jgi:DNA repair exonuclease SbcCD nuclease subunit
MKIKYLIHIADIHIRTFKFHDEYKAVFQNLIDEITIKLQGTSYGEARIVIVGDLFHQKITISNEQIILGAWFLKELSKVAPVVLVAGNHDLLENNKGRVDSITPIINLLGNNNIQYLTESLCYEDENIVWCNYSIFEENARPNIEESRIHNPDKKHIALFHAPIIGAKTDVGYELESGENLSHFEGCDAALLGDIHKRQEFNENGVKCVYPGSLVQQNFGESVHNHGYLFWDVETLEYTEHEVENNHLFFTFKINSLDDIENGSEILVNG